MQTTVFILKIKIILIGFLIYESSIQAKQETKSPPSSSACILESSWEEWPPFVFKEDGKLKGIDIEIAEFLASKTGCKVEWKQMIWKRALNLMRLGKLSFVSGASVTEKRKAWGTYVPTSYRFETMSLFVRKNESDKYKFTSIKELFGTKDFVLGITLDYYYGKEFNSRLVAYKQKINSGETGIQFTVKETNKDVKNYVKLTGRSQEISGFIGEKIATRGGLKEVNLLDKVEIHPLKINEDGVHILFSKKHLEQKFQNKKIVERMDEAIKKYRSNEIQAIIDKYE